MPGIDFETVDYGYKWENSFNTYWAGASDGIRAGLVIGMIVSGVIVLTIIIIITSVISSYLGLRLSMGRGISFYP